MSRYQTVAKRIQLRHDTAANWTTANPLLLTGEFAYELDTGKIKVGDGVTRWNSLAYNGGGGGAAFFSRGRRPSGLLCYGTMTQDTGSSLIPH